MSFCFGDAKHSLHRIQRLVTRRLLLIALALLAPLKARAFTVPSANADQSVLASTTGVIGSISLGNTINKTVVWVSSTGTTAAIGAAVQLSSRTTTLGKTFYIQHIDSWGYLSAPSTTTTQSLGSLAWFSPMGTKLASMSFVNSGSQESARWTLEFAEPLPVSSNVTFYATVTANTALLVNWITTLVGYEK